MMSPKELVDLCHDAVRFAKKHGAQAVAAGASKSRDVDVEWREGRLEKITEATSKSITLNLYVDDRFASVSTSDLRPAALERFIADAVALARTLSPDPLRTLPEPHLYEGRQDLDLALEDPRYETLDAKARLAIVREIDAGARDTRAGAPIVSVSSAWSDNLFESYRVHSNGFEGARRQTSFWATASVTVGDPDGRKPQESAYAGARFLNDLPAHAGVGAEAMGRAQRRVGAEKLASAVLPMVLDNRAAGRLVGAFLAPLLAAALQQKRSFFEGKLGAAVASPRLTITDDPFVLKGFGSRLFDAEGIAARRLPIVEDGVLKNYYVDTYYGKKLKMAPTTSGMSNLSWKLGTASQADLVREVGDGVLVTGFLGGNSNGTTGDFSFGAQGFRIRAGALAEPVAEINISGNLLELWRRLIAIGNDPFVYSTAQSPTLVFEGVQFSGL